MYPFSNKNISLFKAFFFFKNPKYCDRSRGKNEKEWCSTSLPFLTVLAESSVEQNCSLLGLP